jgi:hypothetical protein
MQDSLRTRIAAKYESATGRRYVPANDQGEALSVEVAIEDLRPHQKGSMVAFLDVTASMGGARVRLNDCVLHERGEDTWVNLPSKSYKKRDGSQGYAPLVVLDEETLSAFQQATIRAVESYQPGGAR